MPRINSLQDEEQKSANFIVIQDEYKLWHWRVVNSLEKELYTSAHSWINKDDAIMVGQSYGHTYIGD